MINDYELYDLESFNTNKGNNVQGIYMIKCIKNGRVYVGQSVNIRVRARDHSNELEKMIHPNKKLQNAYNKYGSHSFKIKILEVVKDKDTMTERELYWGKYFNCLDPGKGFNLKPIAAGAIYGEEYSKARSKAILGSKNPNAILTEVDVEKICELLNNGTGIKRIAKMYNVSFDVINSILKRDTWTQISNDILTVPIPVFNRLTESRLENICIDINNGIKDKVISEKYGHSVGTIFEIRRGNMYRDTTQKYLNEFYEPKQMLNEAKIKAICYLLNNRMKTKEIAEVVNTSVTSVLNIRNKNSWKEISDKYLTIKTERKPQLSNKQRLNNEKAVEIRKSNKSIEELSEIYLVSKAAIKDVLNFKTYKDAI